MLDNEMKSLRPIDRMTGNLLFIIECVAFTYSVLRRWGYRLHYPIAAVVERLEVSDEIAGKLGIFQTQVIGTNMPPVEFRKVLRSYHDDLCVLSYINGRYSDENIETILSLVAAGGSENMEIDMPLMLVFQKVIPKEYQDRFSIAIPIDQIELDRLKRRDIGECLNRLKTYMLTKTQILENEISRQPEYRCEGKDFRFWIAAINMIQTVFAYEDGDANGRLRKDLCTALQRAYDFSDSYEFNCQIPSLFRDVFDKSIPEVSKLLPEINADGVSGAILMDMVLYDSEHYYIPEGLFTKICKPLNDICSVNQIKDVLAAEGILCTQGQGRIYRTIKKTVGSSNIPCRFVWLNRAALEGSTMEMSFVDMYQIRRTHNE